MTDDTWRGDLRLACVTVHRSISAYTAVRVRECLRPADISLKPQSYIERLAAAPRDPGLPPVLALGGGITLAAVLNILHKNRSPYYALCPADDFVCSSRWFRRLPTLFPEPGPSDLEAVLSTLDLESAFLLPCSDDWLRAVAQLPRSLAARFPSNTSRSCVEVLTDKWRFAELLNQLRIPHPTTRLIRSTEELSALSDSSFEGAILKPLSSVAFASRHGVKGYVVQGRAQANEILRSIELPILLQEFVPGPPDAGYFLDGYRDRNGRMAALFGRRRLRMHPCRLGNSTVVESVPLRDLHAAIFPLEYLLDRISYCGIFSAEFKYDSCDREFKLIEINARPWWYVEFAAACGVDVCDLAYRDAMRLPLAEAHGYDVGRRGGLVLHDLRAWRSRRGHYASLFSILKTWSSASSTPFHGNDPVPCLRYFFQSMNGTGHHPERVSSSHPEPETSPEQVAPPLTPTVK